MVSSSSRSAKDNTVTTASTAFIFCISPHMKLLHAKFPIAPSTYIITSCLSSLYNTGTKCLRTSCLFSFSWVRVSKLRFAIASAANFLHSISKEIISGRIAIGHPSFVTIRNWNWRLPQKCLLDFVQVYKHHVSLSLSLSLSLYVYIYIYVYMHIVGFVLGLFNDF